MAAFEEMGVLPEIAKATEEMDWSLPTDVQAEAIPLILGGGDVLMAAETGSGKTGAFCLPIIQIVWETLKDLKDGKTATTSAGGGSGSNKWILSMYDRGKAFAITPEGLRCQCREVKDWHGCRATKGVYGSGKYYFEAFVSDEGLCRVGWSTQQNCVEDEECSGNDKCCQDGCGKVCKTPIVRERRNKLGRCPKPSGSVGICSVTEDSCQIDTECPRNLKCCSEGCGKTCLPPVLGRRA